MTTTTVHLLSGASVKVTQTPEQIRNLLDSSDKFIRLTTTNREVWVNCEHVTMLGDE